jgi:hypothetical protein
MWEYAIGIGFFVILFFVARKVLSVLNTSEHDKSDFFKENVDEV